jgi:hypothetical protein
MRIRCLALIVAAAALTQAGCALGFRGEARMPVPPPVMVVPPDPVGGRLEPTPAPDGAPPIPPVPPR